MKKFVSLMMSLVMLLSITAGMNLTVFAADEHPTSGKCGDNVSWNLDLSTKTLTISGTGDMYNYENGHVTWIGSPWNEFYAFEIESVIINDGVTSIGDYAFDDCINLKKLSMPDTITTIGNYAFAYCEKLPNIQFPANLKKIGMWAFLFCEKFTEITIPKSVTSIGVSLFYNCKNLKVISVEAGNQYYSSVDGILLGKNGTELIQFPCASKISDYKIPNTVKIIKQYALGQCNNLTKVTLENVERIEECAFEYSIKLSNVYISKSLSYLGDYAFSECNSLKNIYYSGSKADWNKIKKETQNDDFKSVKINYNSFDNIDSASGGVSGGASESASTSPNRESTSASAKSATVKATGTKSKSKSLAVYWNKQNGVDGYEIQVATDKKFKKKQKDRNRCKAKRKQKNR